MGSSDTQAHEEQTEGSLVPTVETANSGVVHASDDPIVEAIRERERFQWFAARMERWIGLYNVPRLIELLDGPQEVIGQHEKALVLLGLTDDPSALVALEDYDSSHKPASFRRLHKVAIRQWRQRHGMSQVAPRSD